VKLVLRKQPPGKLLASAHAVHREFAVMKALARSPVPVPRALTLCRDPAVLEADFYTMDFVDGHLFLEPSMSGSTPDFRARVYRAMAGVALLHTVAFENIVLLRSEFGGRSIWKLQSDLGCFPHK
jgi:acyl-CoA dehydrogenase